MFCRQNTSSHVHFSQFLFVSQDTALRTVFRFHTHKRGSRIEWAVLKLSRYEFPSRYHCGEKIAKLKLIHFELIFAN